MAEYRFKDSGVEWLGGIPEHWRSRKLKRNYDVLLGKMIQPEQKRSHDKQYPYLRSANMDWRGVKTDSIKKMWFQPFEARKYKLKKDDLLVAEGGDIGKSCLWNEELENCFYQNAINRVRARQRNSTPLLYYWMYYLKHVGFIDSIVNRITIAHLTAEKLDALPILECPPKEQKAIAHYLDKACQHIDKTLAIKQQQLDLLDRYRQSIIHEAVTKGLDKNVTLKDSGVEWLGDIPEHWDTSQIKYLLEFHDNRRIPLSSADRGKMEIRKYDYYGASGVIDHVEDYIFDETMILLGEDGANILTRSKPLAFLAHGKYWVNNHAHILKPKYGSLRYWAYLLEDYDYSLYVTGAAQPKLNSQNLGKLKVIYTKNSIEQKAIAQYLDKACQQIDKSKALIEKQIETLTRYRKSLIHECVTGKKRVYFDVSASSAQNG